MSQLDHERAPTPERRPASLGGGPLLTIVLVGLLVIAAFVAGRNIGSSASAQSTATPVAAAAEAATIPPTITRVPTSTPRPTASPTLTPTPVPTATPIPTPTPVIITSNGVLRRVQPLSRLETALHKIDTVVRAEQPGNPWLLNYGGKKVLMVVEGTVIAGVDLGKLREQDVVVSANGTRVTITLPPAEIFSASLDKSEVYDAQTGAFTELKPEFLEQARQAGKERIRAIACENRILDQATEQARFAIERLLMLLDIDQDNIEVKTTTPGPCVMEVTDS